MKKILIIAVICFMAGCAGPQLNLKNSTMPQSQGISYLIEPYQSVGILETENIRSGNYSVYQGIFPDLLFGEYAPGRMAWYGIAITADGQEFFVQSLLSGINYAGYFVETVIIEGNPEKVKESKVMILSTLIEYGYDLLGEETQLNHGKFLMKADYRKEVVLKHGTLAKNLKPIPNSELKEMMKKWNRFQSPKGVIVTPLGTEEIKLIAGINPQYSYFQKLIGSGKFSISMDPITIVSAMAIDMLKARSVPSVGWDYNSQIPTRRNMAFIIKQVLDMKQQLIQQTNRYNAKLLLEKKGGNE
mgnify:CR=1 FL=1